MKSVFCAAAVVSVAGLCASALAIGPEIICAGVASAPAAKRAVPGLPNNFTTANVNTFNRIFGSPNGQWWATKALIDTGVTTTDEVIILGQGTTIVTVVHEGDACPFDATRHWGTFRQELGINDSGTLAIANNLVDGATTDDELIAKYVSTGGVPTYDSLPYREGVAAPDAGVTSFVPAGATFGATILEPVVLANGGVCAVVTFNLLTGQITASNDTFVYKAGGAIQREGTTSPTGWSFQWQAFTSARYSADGSHSLIDGDDTNASTAADDITTVDNVVKVQAGQTIPGMTNPTSATGTNFAWMMPNGDWLARGNATVANEDWVVVNGTLVANDLGGPTQDITPHTPSGELWTDDTGFANNFFVTTGNSRGDYVITGLTNAAANRNAVMVLNGTTVLLREGDPIDLDGNGAYDDNVYVRTIGDDTAFLTDDGWLYVRISLTSDQTMGGTGANLGAVLVRLRAFTTCYPNCDASTQSPVLNVADFTCFLQKYAAGDPYANCDQSTTPPTLNVADFTCFLQKYAAGCT